MNKGAPTDHLLRASLLVLGALALLLAMVGAPGCRPAAASDRPPPDPSAAALVVQANDAARRVEFHAMYYAGKESWLRVPVTPEPPPPRWWTGARRAAR